MPFVKGSDNKARSIKNPLEGSSGDASLGDILATDVTATGNIVGNVAFTPSTPANWTDAGNVTSVTSALDQLAEMKENLQNGINFTFPGPFSNDSAAAAGGVLIGQVYYGSSGGLVVRQT